MVKGRRAGDVETAAHHSGCRGECAAQHDVGELADRRVGEPGLQVVLGECHDGGGDQSEGGGVHEPGRCPGLCQQVDAEDIEPRLGEGEAVAAEAAAVDGAAFGLAAGAAANAGRGRSSCGCGSQKEE